MSLWVTPASRRRAASELTPFQRRTQRVVAGQDISRSVLRSVVEIIPDHTISNLIFELRICPSTRGATTANAPIEKPALRDRQLGNCVFCVLFEKRGQPEKHLATCANRS